MALLKCVVDASDEKLVTIHREFIKWKDEHPLVARTDFGWARRHYSRLYSASYSTNILFGKMLVV